MHLKKWVRKMSGPITCICEDTPFQLYQYGQPSPAPLRQRLLTQQRSEVRRCWHCRTGRTCPLRSCCGRSQACLGTSPSEGSSARSSQQQGRWFFLNKRHFCQIQSGSTRWERTMVGTAHGVGLSAFLSSHVHLGVVAHLQHIVRCQILVGLVVRWLFAFPWKKDRLLLWLW